MSGISLSSERTSSDEDCEDEELEFTEDNEQEESKLDPDKIGKAQTPDNEKMGSHQSSIHNSDTEDSDNEPITVGVRRTRLRNGTNPTDQQSVNSPFRKKKYDKKTFVNLTKDNGNKRSRINRVTPHKSRRNPSRQQKNEPPIIGNGNGTVL